MGGGVNNVVGLFNHGPSTCAYSHVHLSIPVLSLLWLRHDGPGKRLLLRALVLLVLLGRFPEPDGLLSFAPSFVAMFILLTPMFLR